MANVELSGIHKRYGDHPVLQDLSLTVNHGECFTLLGPSGCGKTTTLRLIAGLEMVSSGTITIGGRDVTS
ncbi:MAG: ABC transporter ATP-binding protein, partial [Acidobacteria bacterium]